MTQTLNKESSVVQDGRDSVHLIMEVFQLNNVELAKLFGVRRQNTDYWKHYGVPSRYRDKLATVVSIVELLEEYVKLDHIPGVVRKAASGYKYETILEMIVHDKHREILQDISETFDWSALA